VMENEKNHEAHARLNACKSLLSETDYLLIKAVEDMVTCETIEELLEVFKSVKEEHGNAISDRKMWRSDINAAQTQIDSEFIDDFATALAAPHLTEVVVNDIYAAREVDTLGVSSALLTEKINENGGNACYIPDFSDIADYLRGHTREGDMILIMGAGDINTVVKLVI